MQISPRGRLDIPDSLRRKILDFRRRVWTIKLIEAVCGAAIGVLLGYLLTYALDRVVDTPRLLRGLIFAAAILACGSIPYAIERWIRRRRRLDQLAHLLAKKYPSIGDQLLGIIELSQNASEQARSPVLVEAAIKQVSETAEGRDFDAAVPRPRHRQRLWTTAALAAAAIVLLVATGPAAKNAWARFLSPWNDVPRYTFASIEPLPETLVVPHGEPFELTVQLARASVWRPDRASIELSGKPASSVPLRGNGYRFELPAQLHDAAVELRVGDYSQRMTVKPTARPELSALAANVQLPKYLGRPQPVERDIRGGALTAVTGSHAVLTATISRELASAAINRQPRTPQGAKFSTPPLLVKEAREDQLTWRDRLGLEGQEPFVLSITAAEDEPPSVICEGLPRHKVLLDSEVLAFTVRARDDFGVKRVGLEWEGLDTTRSDLAKGEKYLAAGGPEDDSLELSATFAATSFGIAPQPIAVRVFVEDFLPNRERIYSPASQFDVLTAEEHAIWITAQLARWHRMSLEVRDRELQLYETNKALRTLSEEELDQPDTRRRIEAQAAAEKTNARRLTGLVSTGDDLLKQAMRNPEIGVGHLERWAEMMHLLKDIAGNRMPSVADLLKKAAEAESVAQASSKSGPKAGQNRADIAGQSNTKIKPGNPIVPVPTVVDIESTLNQPKPGEPKPPSESKAKQPRLTLPTTMLAGNGSSDKQPPPPSETVDEAVRQQEDLLAEFDKIADELNEVLANLEGTTLVKRLKAASRRQHQVASKLGTLVVDAFGTRVGARQAGPFQDLAAVEANSSRDASYIMDDMSAFFERSKYARFKTVLDDMREQDVSSGLRDLGDDLTKETGLSISQAEYWSETFDRWAEDLVEVTKCGACPGCKAKGSLPPSIVLEVLQILEAEVNLREETRVAEQAREAISNEEHREEGQRLGKIQLGLEERVTKVVERIREIPDAEADFAKELKLLTQVAGVMTDAKTILDTPDTGSRAIAAETEAIELLLQSKRFNPKGGGGSGPNPGGGGGGDTHDSALALVGTGMNEQGKRDRSETTQSTGSAGSVLPEEYRAGLDEFFNQLDAR